MKKTLSAVMAAALSFGLAAAPAFASTPLAPSHSQIVKVQQQTPASKTTKKKKTASKKKAKTTTTKTAKPAPKKKSATTG